MKFLLIGVKNREKWKMIYWAGSSLMERWGAELTPMSKSIPVVHQSKMDLSEVRGGGLKIKFGLLTTNNTLVLQQNLSSTCSSGWRVWVCLVVCTSQISEFREEKWDGERKRERLIIKSSKSYVSTTHIKMKEPQCLFVSTKHCLLFFF